MDCERGSPFEQSAREQREADERRSREREAPDEGAAEVSLRHRQILVRELQPPEQGGAGGKTQKRRERLLSFFDRRQFERQRRRGVRGGQLDLDVVTALTDGERPQRPRGRRS